MLCRKEISLKDGRPCLLRSAEPADGREVLDLYIATHAQTGFLLSYPDECTMTAEEEAAFLQKEKESPREVYIVAVVDGKIVGSAGIESKGERFKIAHRAEFGVSVDEAYWSLGVGKGLIAAVIECAKEIGYTQIELGAISDNERAIALYKKIGFTEYGSNPRGFRERSGGYRTMLSMRLEL